MDYRREDVVACSDNDFVIVRRIFDQYYDVYQEGVLVMRIRREAEYGSSWVARSVDTGQLLGRDQYRHDLFERLVSAYREGKR